MPRVMMMLLFIVISYLLFLIEFSLAEQCPSSNYCTCSSNFTIVQCTDRQLTNEFFFTFNNQLSNSTILLNLSSNSFTSIRSLPNLNSLQILDLSFNKFRYFPSNIFSKFPRLISLYIQNNSLKIFPRTLRNLTAIELNLGQINSQQSQIVYENEGLILNCSSDSRPYWTLNRQFYPSTIITSSYSIIILHHLHINHSGIWTCQNSHFNQSVLLTILTNSSTHFCQSVQMNTSKGYFYWPRTLVNSRIETKCPYGSAAWLGNSNEYARAWYTCSSKGQWKHFDISQCGYQTDISRTFDSLSLDEPHLLLHLVRYLADINRNEMKFPDLMFLIDLIDEQQEKYQNQDRIMLIYHLTDFILQIKHHFHLNTQYQLTMNRLRLIIERLLDLTNQSWLYIGKELTAMTLQSPSSSTLCFVSNLSLLTINCDVNHQRYESHLVTIAFPSHSKIKHHQYGLFRMIVYRQSMLFPTDETENNPVVYIRPISRNSISTIRLTFADSFNEVSVGVWQTNQTAWETKSSICPINEQNENFLSTDCVLFNNNSLSVTYFNKKNSPKNIFLNRKYSQFIIGLSSIIAAICFFTSIMIYLCSHKISSMSRHYFHCVINYWFNLGILFPLFALGIELNQHLFLCQFIGISLHYLCLTTILWLTLITYSIWRKLYIISTDPDSQKYYSMIIFDDQHKTLSMMKSKSKPVIQFYLLAYGIALIICGINVVISREQNLNNKICFLNHFDSILILIIPILIFIFLLLIFLLFARSSIKILTKKSRLITNEVFPILSSFPENSSHFYSAKIDHQYESINHLLSILSQLILLVFLFLSSLAIYMRPLRSFRLRFEQIIYCHLYAFFVLFLAFYILSFHVLSRCRLIIRYYFHRTNNDQLSNRSLSIDSMNNKESEIPSSTDSSNIHVNNGSENISNNGLPVLSLEAISRETLHMRQSPRNSSCERSPKRSIDIPITYHTMPNRTTPLHPTTLVTSQSFTHPPISLSRAIIRPIPIIRRSFQNTNKSLFNTIDTIPFNAGNSSRIISSSCTEEYKVIDKNVHLSEERSPYDPVHVSYIDDDDECSVSLKLSITDSKTSSCTVLTKKNRSQTFSMSSSSSSLDVSNDLYSNPLKIHESSV